MDFLLVDADGTPVLDERPDTLPAVHGGGRVVMIGSIGRVADLIDKYGRVDFTIPGDEGYYRICLPAEPLVAEDIDSRESL